MQFINTRQGSNHIPENVMSVLRINPLFKVTCNGCGNLTSKLEATKRTLHGHHHDGNAPTEKNAWYQTYYICPDCTRKE